MAKNDADTALAASSLENGQLALYRDNVH